MQTDAKADFSRESMLLNEFDKNEVSPCCNIANQGAKGQDPTRATWDRRLDFVMSTLGAAVGLSNLWRFPYLCYRNGGGAFLIPYVLSLVSAGIPMLVMEVAIGQYMSTGCLDAWKIVPGFQGIGVGMLVICLLGSMYYAVLLAWTTYYVYSSLTNVLPWSHCDNEWNTDRWKVIQRSPGVDEPGGVVPELALSLLITWVLVFLCIFRGVRWSGKVAYLTVIFPYVLLAILFVRSVTLAGAADGILYYLKPDFERLRHAQVWIDGLSQVFFSNAVACGGLIILGSYNTFHNNFYRDCLVISVVNSGTSFVGGFAVFSVLGFMAKEQNMRVQDVAESGPGLVFIAYPKAVTQMPGAPVWSGLFFLMIFMLGIDSQFVLMEGFLTPMMDLFPRTFYKPRNRMFLTLCLCVASYLVGLGMITEGGVYVFELFNYYSTNGVVLLWITLMEAVAVGWVFGAAKFHDAIELMIGMRIGAWITIGWKYLTPLLLSGTLIFAVIKFQPLTYDGYEFPVAAHALGALVSVGIMGAVPGCMLWSFFRHQGSVRQRWRKVVSPSLKPHQIPARWKRETGDNSLQQDINNGEPVPT